MDPSPSAEIADMARQFGKVVAEATAGITIEPDALGPPVDDGFDAIHAAVTSGSWHEAAGEGRAGAEEMVRLVALVEAAAGARPTAPYPLVEMWAARRLLARLGEIPEMFPTGLVLVDISAALREDDDHPQIQVPHAHRATTLLYLAADGSGGYVVRAADIAALRWSEVEQSDVTRPLFRPESLGLPSDAELGRISSATARQVAAEVVLMEAAEMLGCADALLQATLEHVRTRQQFGRHLGAFQALAHRLADAFVAVETVRSLVTYAAWVGDEAGEQLLDFALIAKGLGARHAWDVGNEAVQMHGAMGFTWDLGLQYPLGRIITRALSFPSGDACLVRSGQEVTRRGGMVPLVE